MATTAHWLPKRPAISPIRAGRSTAAGLTATLSAPASSNSRALSALRTPPPTVSGIESRERTRPTVSTAVPRASGVAETSSTTSSSAPWVS